jgi:hypothetical protein
MRRSIAVAGLALTILSLCQNQYVNADERFQAPSTERIHNDDEQNNEGYFDNDDDILDDSLPAPTHNTPTHNRAEYRNVPDREVVDDEQSEESSDLPESSDTPTIPEAMHATEESDTAVPEPKRIQDDPAEKSEYSSVDDIIEPEVESEEPIATEGMESRASDEPPTEDSVVSDYDAAIPAETNVETEEPLSNEEGSDDANQASSRSEVKESEAPSTVDEGYSDEQVSEDAKASENEEAKEQPMENQPEVRTEEPDDDPSYIDFDDIDSADSSPEQRSTPPEDKLPPSVDTHAAEETVKVEEVADSTEDLDDRKEEESTPKETVNLVDADGEEPSQPDEGSSKDTSSQSEESDINVDELNSTKTVSMKKETIKSAALDTEKTSQPKEESPSGLPKNATKKATADAGKPSEPKKGSLASFFDKVSADPEKASNTMAKATKMPAAITGASASKKDEVLEGEVPLPYCGVWGVFRWERAAHADLSVLFLLFQDYFMSDSDDTGKVSGTKMDKSDMASIMTDEIIRQGQQKREQTLAATPEVSEIIDAAKPKSVNHEFVEGLDDIDKLFEGVDPPDELDVGAAGSSMQEVLMGQGGRILLKRISIGAKLVKKTTISLKNKAVKRFQDKDFKVTLPEKEEALRIAKQVSKQTAQWVWTSSQQVFHTVQAILDDMFEGEDLDDEEFDMPRPPVGARKAGTQEEDEEMEEFLRKYRGSENR